MPALWEGMSAVTFEKTRAYARFCLPASTSDRLTSSLIPDRIGSSRAKSPEMAHRNTGRSCGLNSLDWMVEHVSRR